MYILEYHHYDGKPWVLPSVQLAEREIHSEQAIIPDYGFPGSDNFTKLATQLLLGEDSPAIKEGRVSIQEFYFKIQKILKNLIFIFTFWYPRSVNFLPVMFRIYDLRAYQKIYF